MKDINKAIMLYKESTEFEEDCNTIRAECIVKHGYLMDDIEVEEQAVEMKITSLIKVATNSTNEKEVDLPMRECLKNGHDLAVGDEEEVEGKLWTYCKRCGDWFEIGIKEGV